MSERQKRILLGVTGSVAAKLTIAPMHEVRIAIVLL